MFGSHLSIAGGLHNALLEAERLHMEVAQIFTKNQQQWRCKPLTDEAIAAWRAESSRLGFTQTVSHDSYLINLASADKKLWRASVDLFAEELRRGDLLGIPYLVAHPGAHLGAGEAAGLKRVGQGLAAVYEQIPGTAVITCLEITAGQGTSLGYRLEHLAEIITQFAEPQRLGVCLDTAHLFAAGYDFRGRKYPAFRRQVEATIGLSRVKVLHLNDSKKDLGSRVDRHEHIGQGKIGLSGFTGFVRDPAFRQIPKILETPKEDHPNGQPWDAVNLQVLRSLQR